MTKNILLKDPELVATSLERVRLQTWTLMNLYKSWLTRLVAIVPCSIFAAVSLLLIYNDVKHGAGTTKLNYNMISHLIRLPSKLS